MTQFERTVQRGLSTIKYDDDLSHSDPMQCIEDLQPGYYLQAHHYLIPSRYLSYTVDCILDFSSLAGDTTSGDALS
jgi:hypothetical protein